MRKFVLLYLTALLCLSAAAQPGGPREDRRVKVIIDNDLGGDPDGLFALAHQVLCESSNILGIVGSHLGGPNPMSPGDGAAASVRSAEDLLAGMGLAGKFKVLPGTPEIMQSVTDAKDSEGIRFIVEEARKCTPDRPLFLCVGGALTDVASALLMDPSIASRMIVVWIGGQEYPFGHPQPWGGIDAREWNLQLDIPSVQVVFNNSDVRIWQIPRDAYRACQYSFASMERYLFPTGKTGEALAKAMERWRRFSSAETYCLGDSPLVLIASMQTFFQPDSASSDFVETAAPCITDEGLYSFDRPGRKIRVYTRIDTALMFKDMEDKIFIHESKR